MIQRMNRKEPESFRNLVLQYNDIVAGMGGEGQMFNVLKGRIGGAPAIAISAQVGVYRP